MIDTNLLGTITELKCMTYFLELGYTVSVPQNRTRYDFILDTGDQLLKIQVKSANDTAVEGAITIQTCSQHITSTGNVRQNYQGQVDYFCTYYNNECYLIPIQECGSRTKNLRIVPPKNGQTKNICFAKDYIAKEVLSK